MGRLLRVTGPALTGRNPGLNQSADISMATETTSSHLGWGRTQADLGLIFDGERASYQLTQNMHEKHTCSVAGMSDSVIPWTAASQAPLFMEFSRQESWSGLPFPPSGDLPDPGIEPGAPAASPTMQAVSLLLSHQGSP